MKVITRLLFLILLLLIAGLFINPASAQTNEAKGPCRNDPYPPPSSPPGVDFKYQWSADCESRQSKACHINSDCPVNTSDDNVTAENSNWCYKFDEGNRCLKLKTKRMSPNTTQKRRDLLVTYLQKIEKNFSGSVDPALKSYVNLAKQILNNNLKGANDCLEKINSGTVALRTACKEQVKADYNKSKAAYRLVKYQAILAGTPTTCVEADLGMSPKLEAKGITKIQEKDKDNPKETGKSAKSRLYLCNGADGKIKWRINYNNNLLKITPEDFAQLNLTEDINNLPNKAQVVELKRLLGVL